MLLMCSLLIGFYFNVSFVEFGVCFVKFEGGLFGVEKERKRKKEGIEYELVLVYYMLFNLE